MKKRFPIFLFLFFLLSEISGQMKTTADLIITNARIYTVNESFAVAQAFAVKDGRFLEVGDTPVILEKYSSSQVIDVLGAAVFPGFIDAHCHFYGYAVELNRLDLTGTNSWEEVLSLLKRSRGSVAGDWIVGRGWDQNRWKSKEFPDRSAIDSMFPDRPVVLVRVDGHSLIANAEALRRAGIGKKHKFNPQEVDTRNGDLTGILSENAADFMRGIIPVPRGNSMAALIKRAETNCFGVGLTTVADAGLERDTVEFLDSLQKKGFLKMRIYAMLSPSKDNIDRFVKNGIYSTDRMEVRSIKFYADGSLGSRTALLKKPYSDAPGKSGISVTEPEAMLDICRLAMKYGYQVNTHAIGYSACKRILMLYGGILKGHNDLRWRIEHAQVVDPADVHLFGDFSIVPSVQATHATSDMRWAGDRLGPVRVKGAYAYHDLMLQNGWIANGTDFPIENISPLLTFYAAVTRQDLQGYPQGGFQKENALSREDALRSVTIWAAKACFGEKEKGSIEKGKFADFVILDKDLMVVGENEIPTAKVVMTYVGGVLVY